MNIDKICEQIKEEFELCFSGISDDFVIDVDPDPYYYDEDTRIWCSVTIKHNHHSKWICCLSAELDAFDRISVELEESGMEPISPTTIWRLMFFDALHDLWTIRER